jgi:superfamily I DNA/RNA helicase
MAGLVDPKEWRPRGIEELEPNAEWAVRADVNALIAAGPGAGKTELLAQRASFLLETGACPSPRRILAISFKRDAARNLRERVVKRCGEMLGRRFDSLTFDAFAKALLDQFREALPEPLRPTPDYDVLPGGPSDLQVADVLQQMKPPRKFSGDLREFETQRFFREKALFARFDQDPATLEAWAAREFWAVMLGKDRRVSTKSRLYFPMITRLAGELVGADERVKRAYRSTYTHVFLDEFQDTTRLQYWLTRRLFQGSGAIVTAVGDAQQRIMVWAGAQRDVFPRFEEHFGASKRRLERNRRASSTIAPIVAYLAARIGAEYGGEEIEFDADDLLGASGPPEDECAAFLFDHEDHEAEWMAGEIHSLLKAGASPRDVCILARQKPADYCATVMARLASLGVTSRLEDAMQDLLSEPATNLAILGLRAMCSSHPGPDWGRFRGALGELRGLAFDDDEALRRLEGELQEVRRGIVVSKVLPSTGVRDALRRTIEPLFRTAVVNRYPQYKRGTFYEDTLGKLSDAIEKTSATAWEAALDIVEGKDAVPVLTIHKSKGLEYTAVFFVGLEDGAFWNFSRTPDEELNTFFVALSRAKRRVAFTFARERNVGKYSNQSRRKIDDVYKLLQDAGVPVVEMGSGDDD